MVHGWLALPPDMVSIDFMASDHPVKGVYSIYEVGAQKG
jgi:hypothetical protein